MLYSVYVPSVCTPLPGERDTEYHGILFPDVNSLGSSDADIRTVQNGHQIIKVYAKCP